MYKKKFMVILLLIFKNAIAANTTNIQQERHITDSIDQINIELEEGNLSFVGIDNNDIKILAKPNNHSCQDNLKIHNQKLEITNKKNQNGCKCDYTIYLPRNVVIDIKSGSSNIEINDMTSPLKVKNGAGNIKSNGMLERANIDLGSGNVSLTINKYSSSIKIGSGNGTIKFPVIPVTKVDLEILIGSGNANVIVPMIAKVDYEIKSLTNYNISSDDPLKANFRIKMMVGSGKATVDKF